MAYSIFFPVPKVPFGKDPLYVQTRLHKEIDPNVTAATEAKPSCSRLENQVIFLARDPSLRWLFHPQVWPLLTIRFIRQPLGCHTTEVRRHYTIWFCWMVGSLMFDTYPYDLNFWIVLPRFYVLNFFILIKEYCSIFLYSQTIQHMIIVK